MSDVFTPKKRSEIMSRIRGKDTEPEIIVRKYLFSKGFRFRKNDQRYPGKPDVVLPKYKTVIFVHGCFWHGHEGCKYATIPKTNKEYWSLKIQKNRDRDMLNRDKLEKLGFYVMIIWECELKRNSVKVLEDAIIEFTDRLEG
jgi:DNA mismatch endonuclease (patch repair protein)